MEILLLAGLLLLAALNLFLLIRRTGNGETGTQLRRVEESMAAFKAVQENAGRTLAEEFQRSRNESGRMARDNRDELAGTLRDFAERLERGLKSSDSQLRQRFADFAQLQSDLTRQTLENIKEIEQTIAKNLQSIREDNTRQLEEMRRTVDEKLQSTLEKRLGESFRQVSERLEQVHKGLGEMQTIAAGVGDLKKVLSNVKTRGMLGEYQLANILEQILAPGQYAANVATKKGSQANVEFAIRLPGKSDDKAVWLPVDSKFPLESYRELIDAYERGERDEVEVCRKKLVRSIETFAKTIRDKYIDPPNTTDFGIMFLPVEGLYAEVLRDAALFESLQREYKITITGPTTLSALLNSLQMGFRTLAVQKRSSEVWEVLKGVKGEFTKFSDILAKVRKQLDTATGTLDTLQTTRTNQINRKLDKIETIETVDADMPLLPAVDENGGDI